MKSSRIICPCSAWTLTELLVSMGIMGSLMVVLISAIGAKWKARAEMRECQSNLSSLAAALEMYVQDHTHWPQLPEDLFSDNEKAEEDYYKFWYDSLKEYDIDQRHLLCPTDRRALASVPRDERGKYEGSYCFCMFDKEEASPRRYVNQAWVAERGDFHGYGNLCIFPDGFIGTMLPPPMPAQ